MATRQHETDRGLHAVARVREVRERDSRLGLQQALLSAQRREQEAVQVVRDLDQAPPFSEGGVAEFTASRQWLAGMAVRVRLVQDQACSSAVVAEQARRHWQSDKTRLRAVEYLLEKRAEARAVDLARKDAVELDDVAARLWLRRRNETTENGTHP